MAITRVQKEKVLEELKQKVAQQKIIIFADYRGLSVEAITGLRRELSAAGAELKVAKVNLVQKALKEAGITVDDAIFTGPTAFVLGYEDEVTVPKILTKFMKTNENLKLLGGWFGENSLTIDQVKQLSKIPGREELYGQLVGVIAGPMRGLVVVMSGLMRNFVSVIDQYKQKIEKTN